MAEESVTTNLSPRASVSPRWASCGLVTIAFLVATAAGLYLGGLAVMHVV